MSELKYFETENYHGKLKNVPRVIIGIDLGHVVTLAEKWTQSSETIGENPMQIIVLREIAKQCEHFAHIASEEKTPQKLEGSDSALIKKLEAVIAIYEKNQKMFLDILRKQADGNARVGNRQIS